MKVFVDPDICIGCTLCTQSCSEVFKMKDDKAVVYKDSAPQEAHECARKAAEECPVQAITLNQ
jgi:ferredoxin